MAVNPMRIALFAGMIALTGCQRPENAPLVWYEQPSDPQVFAYVHQQCMASARGPQSTTYSDWDEAIQACDGVAANASRYCPAGRECSTNSVTLAQVRAILPREPFNAE